jgi:hypothetical protein
MASRTYRDFISQTGLVPGDTAKQVEVCFDGDSKSSEPSGALAWALSRQPMSCWRSTDFGVGGSDTSSTSTNLTSASRLATTAASITTKAASGPVDIWLTTGTNNNTTISSEDIISNIRKYHNTMRTAGLRYLILCNIDPRTSGGSNIIAKNRAYADYCKNIADAFYCDTSAEVIDPTDTTNFSPIGQATGSAFTFGADGLHANAWGIYMKSFGVQRLAETLYRTERYELVTPSDVYSSPINIRGNLLGVLGRTLAIGGTNSITNSGTGGLTGTPPSGWTASGTLTGDMGIAFSAATCTLYDTYANTSGTKCVRMTLSGTPSSTTTITIQRARSESAGTAFGTTPYRVDALLAFNSLVGVGGFACNNNNIGSGLNFRLGSSTPAASDQFPTLNTLHQVRLQVTPASNQNSTTSLIFYVRAGVTVSGSIDILGAVQRFNTNTPAAAA